MDFHQSTAEDWKVTLVDTGTDTMTGGRLKRVKHYLDDETFCFTYGDGVGDVDITSLIAFHKSQGRLATVTGVHPPGRFGSIAVNDTQVSHFSEKTDGSDLINGGFFVLEPAVLDVIDGDAISWEREPLEKLSAEGQLSCFRHSGFWKPMDTLRDRLELERLWQTNNAAWKVWS